MASAPQRVDRPETSCMPRPEADSVSGNRTCGSAALVSCTVSTTRWPMHRTPTVKLERAWTTALLASSLTITAASSSSSSRSQRRSAQAWSAGGGFVDGATDDPVEVAGVRPAVAHELRHGAAGVEGDELSGRPRRRQVDACRPQPGEEQLAVRPGGDDHDRFVVVKAGG